jgi:hypothetical protein
MAISPENKARLLSATKEAAAAFVEDMAHIRELLAKNDWPSREIRHLSAVLRRLLVENDIRSIAPPRIDRMHFNAPDNNEFYHATKKHFLFMFVSGGPPLFGYDCRALAMFKGKKPHPDLTELDKTLTISLPLDGFLNQKVIAFDNKWISRRQVIKYVANTASGVHSQTIQTDDERSITRMRRYMKVEALHGGLKLSLDDSIYDIGNYIPTFKWSSNTIDFVLYELISIAHFLVTSPDALELEKLIVSELTHP